MEAETPWIVAPPAPPQLYRRFDDLPPLLVQLLYNRGLTAVEEVRAFLTKDRCELPSPFTLPGMSEAVRHLRIALAARKPIAVYGDYDADGVTATALLTHTLRALGARVLPYIPDRFDEGYGLHTEAIQTLAAQGAEVLLSVDCGIRATAEVTAARRAGMTVIITDHHHLGKELPPAHAVINPRREGTPTALHHLAGVGVAYFLADALLRAQRQAPLPVSEPAPIEARTLLDFVAIGTIGDLVPLRGGNHHLVRCGLEQIEREPHPGIAALLAVSRTRRVDEEAIAYQLAPRLNAAGRMQHAHLALDLLLSRDEREAMTYAKALEKLNTRRRKETQAVQRAAIAAVEHEKSLPPLLFIADADFPPGVIGLAASRLVDRFQRPAVVIHRGDEFSTGSCRVPPGYHITRALEEAADLLVRYGGHAAAAGFTVRTTHLPDLHHRLLSAIRRQEQEATPPPLLIEAEVELRQLSWEIYHLIQQLAPFGTDNPIPLLASRHVHLLSARAVGRANNHLKLRLADTEGRLWDGIAFGMGKLASRLGPRVDLAYTLARNEWHGRVNLELQVQAIRPTEAE